MCRHAHLVLQPTDSYSNDELAYLPRKIFLPDIALLALYGGLHCSHRLSGSCMKSLYLYDSASNNHDLKIQNQDNLPHESF